MREAEILIYDFIGVDPWYGGGVSARWFADELRRLDLRAGDKLTVDNVAGYDRFGKGGTSDVNIGFKTGNGTWGAWTDPNLPGNQVPVGGGAATAAGGLLSGNPLDVIRAEIAKLMGGNAKPNLQALLAQFGLG